MSYEHLLEKTRDVLRGGVDAWSVQSTGEKIAVALVLNRFDWLSSMNYTIAEAIHRLDGEWLSLVPRVAKVLEKVCDFCGEVAPAHAEGWQWEGRFVRGNRLLKCPRCSKPQVVNK